MKKLTVILFLFSTLYLLSQENPKFALGFFRNTGTFVEIPDGYESAAFNWNRYNAGLKLSVNVPVEKKWFYYMDFDFAFLSDSGVVTKSYDDLTKINIAKYKTFAFGSACVVNRKFGKYLAMGTGLKIEFRKSNFNDYYFHGLTYRNEKFEYSGGLVSIPINADFYFPISTNHIIWKNSFFIALNNSNYFQTGFSFQF
jgi:hypothetical protein